jgi:hypothetical protein
MNLRCGLVLKSATSLSFLASLLAVAAANDALAGSLRLTWSDNSTNESGFRIERKTGVNGSFIQIATAAANTTAYVDTGLIDGTTYCYRVLAYDSSRVSAYSNENCNVATPTTGKYTLNIAKSGTGSGTVTSAPAGIACGSDCSELYDSGTRVTLSATAASGSVFAGWSNASCGSGFNITTNTSCTATFNVAAPAPPTTYLLTVGKSGTGSGTVTSTPAGINCGSDCTETYNSGTGVTLFATAAAGSTFVGWSPAGCANSVMTSNTTCTASFQLGPQLMTRIGVFRPSTGEWFLDLNGNGTFDGCGVDKCIATYGNSDSLPIVGDWIGDEKSKIGVFEPNTGAWHLDDGDGKWGACGTSGDICIDSFGGPGRLPVAKDLTAADRVMIGTFQSETSISNGRSAKQGLWRFDRDGDGVFKNCSFDECVDNFGAPGDLPVVGDWSRAGVGAIGFFRPQTGEWYLDYNNNGKWDGSSVDKLFSSFGGPGDLPIVGDWDGKGIVRIGIFQPATRKWFLDLNGNGKLDACGVDVCLGPFGNSDDLPVVGNW